MVSSWLKGRISFLELQELPLGTFHYLHTLVLNESRSEEGKNNKAAEQMSDEIEQAIMR